MAREISRAAMSQQERLLRSRASWLLQSAGILHGNLSSRLVRCGKKGCRCARGERHQAFVLVLRREGKTVQVPIPRDLEPLVRRWLSQERELSGLLSELSRLHEERIRELKRKKE